MVEPKILVPLLLLSHAALAAELPTEESVPAGPIQIPIVAISDFHGWLEPLEGKGRQIFYGGLANIAGFLENKEGLTPESSILLDVGDSWTGQANSTMLKGQPVVAAYNSMGVDTAVIGNHEFDFGLEIMRTRISEARYPYLAANIFDAKTKELADFVQPFEVVDIKGVRVGIIGLAFMNTAEQTFPQRVRGYSFGDYEQSLRKWVPRAREKGADLIIVAIHDSTDMTTELAKKVADLDIPLFVCGQEHRHSFNVLERDPSTKSDDTIILNAGGFGRTYGRVDLFVDSQNRKVISHEANLVMVTGSITTPPYPPSAAVAEIVKQASEEVRRLGGEVLAEAGGPLMTGTFDKSPIGNLVVDAWLSEIPSADFAICNHGAFRQPLGTGPITLSDVVSVLPFDNNLYVVRLTGKQVKEQLAIDDPVVGGLTFDYKLDSKKKRVIAEVRDSSGAPLSDSKTYKVVINNFMYEGGDGYLFKKHDSAPLDTGLHWRDPVLRLLKEKAAGGRKVDPDIKPRAKLLQ